MRTRNSILGFWVICCTLFLLYAQAVVALEKPMKTITDIAHWQHPVHTVFLKNHIDITRVEFFEEGKYPVFFAKLTLDPTSSQTEKFYNKLYFSVLEANGFWDYAINDAEDQLLIKIHWDKRSKNMTKTYEDTVDKKE